MEYEAYKQSKQESQKKRRTGLKRALYIVGALLLLGILIAVSLGWNLLSGLNRTPSSTFEDEDAVTYTPTPAAAPTAAPPTPTPAATPEPTPLPLSELYTQTILAPEALERMEQNLADTRFIQILLIGVDRRGSSGNSRADTVMIATIDKKNNRLKLTTLMRDMLVNIPGHGYGKMNTAAAVGGVELLTQTINENFHMNLHEYVLVDFNMFEQIIDELGGITIKMKAEEISAANDCIAGLNKERGEYLWDGFIFAEAGNVKLTGKQALGYARVRHIDSEFSRTTRQFKVLNTVFAVFKQAGVSKQYKLLQGILPLVKTNITNARILECAVGALGMDVNGLLYYRLPAEDLFENGKWERKFVFLCDIPANAQALHGFLFDSQEAADDAKVLTPGASLPPRTPSVYLGEDGNYYYYSTGQAVPPSTPDFETSAEGPTYSYNGIIVTVDEYGNLVDMNGNIVAAAGTWQAQ
ncbi:MAG: LCP family protein [Christensenellaceae bacterium]|jgi:LCP family protein required for cell wall assembly|nr:LCP family protein [Christensenellaceae bacterium]